MVMGIGMGCGDEKENIVAGTKLSCFWTGHVVPLSPPLFAFGLKM